MSSQRKKSKAVTKGVTLDLFLEGQILYDSVLIRPIVMDKVGSIIKPQQYEDKPEFGEVLMVGEGRIFDNGTIIPLKVKVGQIVYFQKYSSTKLRVEGEDLHIVREEDIYWHEKILSKGK